MNPFAVTVLLLLLLAAAPLLRADDQVRRAQEELRKRNLYFGEVDGRTTEETSSAVRRFQERKGLHPTGNLTAETLRSLNLPADESAPAQDEWPEGPVLRSDSARQIAMDLREKLESAATGELDPVAEGPEADSPEPLAEEAPAAPSPVETENVHPPTPPAEREPRSGAKLVVTKELQEQTRLLVEQYLQACEHHTPEAEMKFYADRVNYFDHGLVDRNFVARDVKRFYDRWPERDYQLLNCRLTRVQGAERDVSFEIAFKYAGAKRHASGRSVNNFRLRVDEQGPQFTAMKEQRLRE